LLCGFSDALLEALAFASDALLGLAAFASVIPISSPCSCSSSEAELHTRSAPMRIKRVASTGCVPGVYLGSGFLTLLPCKWVRVAVRHRENPPLRATDTSSSPGGCIALGFRTATYRKDGGEAGRTDPERKRTCSGGRTVLGSRDQTPTVAPNLYSCTHEELLERFHSLFHAKIYMCCM
jgi:hypothetical protein